MTEPGGESRTLALLDMVPKGSSVAMVIRHAEREDIAPGTFGNDVPLTQRGRHSAHRLGEGLSRRTASMVKSSPLPRCIQTAQAVIAGAGWATDALPDPLLGDPGPFVVDPVAAGKRFLDIGIEAVVRRQLTDDEPPDGMRPTSAGVLLVLDQVTAALTVRGGVSLFVTHDAVLAVLVGSLYGLPVDGFRWPDYLDALVLWRDSDRLQVLWRGLGESSHPLGS